MDAAKEQIGELLVRYATGIDRRDWALFRSCWTDDVSADYGVLGQYTDADSLTEVMRASHHDMGPTYHRMTNLVIEVDGDTATARSYVHAVLMLQPGDEENWIDVVGHYDDELVRGTDGWRISRRVSHTARMITGGALAASLTGKA
jgi:3-phenylpropionate/cinnamic acid dioxygenase small subunit